MTAATSDKPATVLDRREQRWLERMADDPTLRDARKILRYLYRQDCLDYPISGASDARPVISMSPSFSTSSAMRTAVTTAMAAATTGSTTGTTAGSTG